MWNLGTTPGPMQGRGKCSLLLLLLREQRAGQRPEPLSLSPDTKEQQETEAKEPTGLRDPGPQSGIPPHFACLGRLWASLSIVLRLPAFSSALKLF